MSFEQTFKNIDDILRLEVPTALDYTEQSSWILFLRYLDELEEDKSDEAELKGEVYEYILAEEFRWSNWAMPKNIDKKLDHHLALTGPDLIQFVDHKLFLYLASFRDETDNPNTIEYKIGEIFSEIKNKIRSGYNLREILEAADKLPFRTSQDKHELSALYEEKIKNMGNAGRNGGEYYTPRPLIRAMIKIVNPQIGEKVYDGAAGSCGFLCEAYDYLLERMDKTTDNLKTLQEKTFYGKEKKSLAYVIGIMNMILHGIEAPNIVHTNTLGENVRDIQEKDRYHVVLANPPFGGKERKEVQQNFDIKTGETAFLFLQHFIKSLKTGGRAAIVIKNTVLSNDDNGAVSLRKYLLESCNLHTILDMPKKSFAGAGVKTVVLFFTKGEPTKKTWYYQLTTEKNLGKTNPLRDSHIEEFLELQKTKSNTNSSWTVKISDVDKEIYDLSVNNPIKPIKRELRSPIDITTALEQALMPEAESVKMLGEYTSSVFEKLKNDAEKVRIGDVCEVIAGQSPESKFYNKDGNGLPFYQGKKEFRDKVIGEPTTWTTKITKEAMKDDILMSVRAPVGPVNFASEKICIGRGLAAIRAGKKINREYLFYYFLHHEGEINGKEGAVFNSINKGEIADLIIPLPSIEKQNEIVFTLNEANKEVSKVELMIAEKLNDLEELKRSLTSVAYDQLN